MLETLDEEINPHHRRFAVPARDDNDIQTIGFHTYEQTNARHVYGHSSFHACPYT